MDKTSKDGQDKLDRKLRPFYDLIISYWDNLTSSFGFCRLSPYHFSHSFITFRCFYSFGYCQKQVWTFAFY